MTKYEQLARLIEIGLIREQVSSAKALSVLARIWNNWSRLKSVIDICPDSVDKMALDYLNFLDGGYPKPGWFEKLDDLG